MPSSDKPPESGLQGTRLKEIKDHEGGKLLSKNYRDVIIQAVNSFFSPKITVKMCDGDGNYLGTETAKIKMGPLGWTAELPDTVKPGYINAGIIVLPGNIYQITNLTNPADSYRTLQIRDFFIGYRPLKSSGSTSGFNAFEDYQSNNYEQLFGVRQDNQGGLDNPNINAAPVPSGNGVVQLQNLTDVEIGTEQQIVLSDITGIDPNKVDYQCSFFVEIIDDGTNLGVKLWGRMWNGSGSALTQQTPWPTGPNIIPIGGVRYAANGTIPLYSQVQAGSLTNRYPPGITTDRGNWTIDALANQYFYPNDIVTTDVLNISSHNFYQRFRRLTYGRAATAPVATTTDWFAEIL